MIWSPTEAQNRHGTELLYECEACIKLGPQSIHVLDAERLGRLVNELNMIQDLNPEERQKLASFSAVLQNMNTGATFMWMGAVSMLSTTAPAPLPGKISRMPPTAPVRKLMQSLLIQPTEKAPNPPTTTKKKAPPKESNGASHTAKRPQKSKHLKDGNQFLLDFSDEQGTFEYSTKEADLATAPKESDPETSGTFLPDQSVTELIEKARRCIQPGLFEYDVISDRTYLTLLLGEMKLHRVPDTHQKEAISKLFEIALQDRALRKENDEFERKKRELQKEAEERERKELELKKKAEERNQQQREQLQENEEREQKYLAIMCEASLADYERTLSDHALFGWKNANLPPELEKRFDKFAD